MRWRLNWLLSCGLLSLAALGLLGLALLRNPTAHKSLQLRWKAVLYPGGINGGKMNGGDLTAVGADKLLHSGLWSDVTLSTVKGQTLWTFAPALPNEKAIHTCVGHDGSIYVGTNKNQVYAFDKTGKQRWVFPAKGTKVWTCYPTVAPDGTVYVSASDGVMYRINPDGTQAWRANITGLGREPLSLAADGTVYGSSSALEVIAISPEGRELWRSAREARSLEDPYLAADGRLIYLKHGHDEIEALNPDGSVAWLIQASFKNVLFQNGAAVGTGNVFYSVEDSPTGGMAVVAMQSNGQKLWSYPCNTMFGGVTVSAKGEVQFVDTAYPLMSRPGPVDQLTSGLARSIRGQNCRLQVLSPQGRLLHSINVPVQFTMGNPIARPDGSIIILGFDGVLYCYK